MYAPTMFREDRQDVLLAALGQIGLGALVAGGDALEAAHVPFLIRPDATGLVLEAHVARVNPLWRAVGDGAPALAIFQGPHAYVHPGWYATKQATGRVVPTWNYVVVHARGRLSVIDDADWLLRHVTALSAQQEAASPQPWAVSDAPADYIDRLVRDIVGVRLAVDRLEGVWKLSQNHPPANRSGVIAGLEATDDPGDTAVAAAMRAVMRPPL